MATIRTKTKPRKGIGEDAEKLEPLHTVGRNGKWYSHDGNQYGKSSKTK